MSLSTQLRFNYPLNQGYRAYLQHGTTLRNICGNRNAEICGERRSFVVGTSWENSLCNGKIQIYRIEGEDPSPTALETAYQTTSDDLFVESLDSHAT